MAKGIELASAYVSISADTSKMAKQIKDGFNGADKAASSAGDRMGKAITTSAGKHAASGGTMFGKNFTRTASSSVQGGFQNVFKGADAHAGTAGTKMANVFVKSFKAGIAGGALVGAAGLSAAVAALAGTFKSVVDTGVSFEKQMNNLAGVTGASAAEIQKIRRAALGLGSDTKLAGTSAQDAAAAMTELAKSGMDVQQSISAARGVLQLATAGQISAADAAEMVSNAMNVWGIDASKATDIADDFAAAVLASSLDMPDLAQAMQAGANAGQTFGISMEDTLATLATFAQLGIKGSDAGTLFKTMLLSWQNPSEPQAQAMEELNLQLSDAEGHFVGILPLMEQLKTAHDRMTEAEYNNAAAAVFGSDAFRGAAIAGGRGIPIYNAVKKEIEGTGQAAEMAAAQMKGLPGVIEAIKNTWEGFKLNTFDVIAPALTTNLEKLSAWVSDHKPEIIEFFTNLSIGVLESARSMVQFGQSTLRSLASVAQAFDKLGPLVKVLLPGFFWTGVDLDAFGKGAENLRGLADGLEETKAPLDDAIASVRSLGESAVSSAEFVRGIGGATAEIKGADIVISGNFEEIQSKIDTTQYEIQSIAPGQFRIIPKTDEATADMKAWRVQQEGTPVMIGLSFQPTGNLIPANMMPQVSSGSIGSAGQGSGGSAPSGGIFGSGWMGYDTGGWLQQGFTAVVNKSGKPELVLNPQQTKSLSGALGAAGIDGASIAPHMAGMGGGIGNGQKADLSRTQGFMPAVAQGNNGVAGTSSLAAIFNLGNEAVGGLIDTGASLAKMAVSAAATAGVGAGTMGAGAAAGPAASAAAGYGIDLAATIGKRVSSYGFQMASIFADAGIEQLFPFGAPRWLGYDYTQFAPQLGIQQALTTSLEQAAGTQIDQMFGGGQRAAAIRGGAAAAGAMNQPMAAGFSAVRGSGRGAPMPTEKPPPDKNPFAQLFGGQMGGVYDSGGILQPGAAALNMSNQPEAILTQQQWNAMAAQAHDGGGRSRRGRGGVTYNVTGVDLDDTMRELRKTERRNNMRYTSRSGLGT